MLLVAAAIVVIWLIVKSAELVIRVIVAHPRNRAIWIALAILLAAALAAAVSGGNSIAVSLFDLSILSLLVTAKAVELYHDQLFQPEIARDDVVREVLHEPWWSLS